MNNVVKVAGLGIVAVALTGCHALETLDVVNTCAVPVQVYGGVEDHTIGASKNIYRAEPGHPALAYYVEGDAETYIHVRAEGDGEWLGPLAINTADAQGAFSYDLPEIVCSVVESS